jgi:NAD(P)-dependent dehydrogenase (short-subunit alcohol dehydrogenase family)
VPSAIVIGSSAGIGLATTRRLLAAGWSVTGLARRTPPIDDDTYRHVSADVRGSDFADTLRGALDAAGPVDACIYCAGIGRELDPTTMAGEAEVFAVNLVGAVVTAEVVIPRMIAAGRGHLLGVSSQADRLIDGGAPSYAASKAGLSSYLEGLGKACKPRGVAVTNVRFGFVDTAMSEGQVRPFLITAEQAAEVIERALKTRPRRVTVPKKTAALLWFVRKAT